MPISSGAAGRRLGRDGARPAASIASARSTPNLAQPAPAPAAQSAQGRTGRRMIDAPPRVETRRRLGSQTLYGSRPPWATDEDAPSPKKEQQTPTTPQQQDQQQQPPFYPAGGDLLHGEAARMRRIKAARELYKSPHSRRKHNTGSVDDLLRDCAVSDHSHSPSPVRRTPSAASSVNRSTTDLQAQKERPASRPGPSTRSTGVGTTDGASSGSPLRRRQRKEESIESDDSLDDGERRRKGVTGDSHGSRQRQSRTSRGTSPPPPEKPLYVDTGCDALDWGASKSPSTRQSFGRSKMAPGLKPAAERKYVPPPPVRQPSPSVKKHDCLPSDRPAFKARPMPDFRRVSPSPGRSNRSRSQSPARRAAPAQTSSATTSGYRSGGGGSSPPGRRDHQSRRRSMDEDSLTEASSAGPGDRSVATEVLQPQKAPAPEDRRAAAADAMDSGFRSLEPRFVSSATGNAASRVDSGSSGESSWENCDSADTTASDQLIDELVAMASSAAVSQSDIASPEEAIDGKEGTVSRGNSCASSMQDSHSVSSGLPHCQLCRKRVYPLEMFCWNDWVLHKSCFKCHSCKAQLNVKSFAQLENKLYCLLHYEESKRDNAVQELEVPANATSLEEKSECPDATGTTDTLLPLVSDIQNRHSQPDSGHSQRLTISTATLRLQPALQHTRQAALVVRFPAENPESGNKQQQKQPIPQQRRSRTRQQQQQQQRQQQTELLQLQQQQADPGTEAQPDGEDIQRIETPAADQLSADDGFHSNGRTLVADRIRELQSSGSPEQHVRASNPDEALPAAGTTRSLLNLWREREALQMRQPPRQAGTGRRLPSSSQPPGGTSGAGRPQLRTGS